MADDIGDLLVVTLDARINKLENAMQRATDRVGKTFGDIESRAKQSTARLETEMAKSGTAIERIQKSLSSFGAGAFTGIGQSALLAVAPMLSLGAAIAEAHAALDTLGDINDKSIAAGLDPSTFQTIATAAKSAGVEVDTTAAALAVFAKDSGLAANGQGELVSTLGKLDPALLKSIQDATTQEQRVRLAADALDKATDSATRAALANALFGRSGAQIAAAFEGGGKAIDAMSAKLRDAGDIYDTALVRRSDDLGDQLDLLTQKIDVQLKTAFVNLGPEILAITGWIGDWIQDLNIVLDQFRDIESRSLLRPLQNSLVDTENRIASIKDQMAALQPGAATPQAGPWTGAISFGEAQRAGAIQSLDHSAALTTLQKQLDDAYATAQQLQERIDELSGKPGGDDRTPVTPGGAPTISRVSTIAKAAKEASPTMDDMTRKVDTLSKAWQTAESDAESFAGTFLGDLKSGKSLIDSLTDAASKLASTLEQMAVNDGIKSLFNTLSGGLLGGSIAGGAAIPSTGFIPGLTGPRLFAGGGYTGDGGRDEPAGIVHRGEVVWSQSDVARHGGAAVVDAMRRLPRFADGGIVGGPSSTTSIGGNSTHIAISAPVTVNANGGDPAANADLAKQIGSELENRMRGIVTEQLLQAQRPGNLLARVGARR